MQQTLIGCAFCDAVPGADMGGGLHLGKRRASHAPDLRSTVTITLATGADSSSTHLQPSRGSVSNSATWKAHCSGVHDVVPVGRRRIGRVTWPNTSSSNGSINGNQLQAVPAAAS